LSHGMSTTTALPMLASAPEKSAIHSAVACDAEAACWSMTNASIQKNSFAASACVASAETSWLSV